MFKFPGLAEAPGRPSRPSRSLTCRVADFVRYCSAVGGIVCHEGKDLGLGQACGSGVCSSGTVPLYSCQRTFMTTTYGGGNSAIWTAS
jgi:hypothetical protein